MGIKHITFMQINFKLITDFFQMFDKQDKDAKSLEWPI